MNHATREVVHFNVTRHPTDDRVAQQLRKETPYDHGPGYLIRGNDGKSAVCPHFKPREGCLNYFDQIANTPFVLPMCRAAAIPFVSAYSVLRQALIQVNAPD